PVSPMRLPGADSERAVPGAIGEFLGIPAAVEESRQAISTVTVTTADTAPAPNPATDDPFGDDWLRAVGAFLDGSTSPPPRASVATDDDTPTQGKSSGGGDAGGSAAFGSSSEASAAAPATRPDDNSALARGGQGMPARDASAVASAAGQPFPSSGRVV